MKSVQSDQILLDIEDVFEPTDNEVLIDEGPDPDNVLSFVTCHLCDLRPVSQEQLNIHIKEIHEQTETGSPSPEIKKTFRNYRSVCKR